MKNKILEAIVGILSMVFGRLQYQPPEWLRKIWQKLKSSLAGRWIESRATTIKANPKKSAKVIGGAVAAIALVFFGVQKYRAYLDSLPKPDYVTVNIYEPQEPDLETGKSRNLSIRFSKSAARVDQLDKPVVEGIALRPAMKGSWRWDSDSQLEFTPEKRGSEYEQWKIGEEYTIILDRKLFPKHVLLEELEYKFKTPKISGHYSKSEFYQDPRDPQIKKAVFNIRFNYALDTEDIKKRISMTMQEKDEHALAKRARKIGFTVSFGEFKNEVFIVSDPIGIPLKDSRVEVKVERGVRTLAGGKTEDDYFSSVDVPGMYNFFRFENSNVSFARNAKFEPEQILILNTLAELPSENVAKVMKLYLLPAKKKEDVSGRQFSYWESPAEITSEIRQALKPVSFTVVPTEEENSKMHTFKINVPVGRSLYIEIPKGLKSYGGYVLAEKFEDIVRFGDYPKELMIMSQGSILSFSGDKKVPLLARNIRKAEVRLYRILPAQLNQFVNDNYRHYNSFGQPGFPGLQKETLSEIFKKEIQVPFHNPAATQYFSVDLDEFMPKDSATRKGIFYLEVYSSVGPSDRRLVVVTDLGVIVKEANDKSHQVFVQNLRTGGPVADAEISVLGANGLSVLEQKTTSDGKTSFPDLREFKHDKRPIAFLAKKGADLAYLPYHMGSRQLQYSRFDVGGVRENPESDQLTSYLFSDRGIYRPGDLVNLGMMVRARNWKKHFDRVPLVWTVTDPRGTEVKRETLDVSSDDLTSMSFNTQDAGATGVYQIRVFIVKKNRGDEQIGSLAVRVEEFLPDRMRISARIEGGKPQGWVSPESLKGRVTLTNLFGTPAENRRVLGEINVNPAHPWFKAYKDYRFAGFKDQEKPYSESLPEGETNDKGEAEFAFDLHRFTTGMYILRFDAEGFEAEGGRAVGASASTLVSTLPYLLGLKSDESTNYLKKNSQHQVQVIAIDPDLKKIAASDTQVVIVERRYVSALMQQPDGTYKYHSVLKEVSGEPKPFKVDAKGSLFKLPTETPGDFVAVFKNKSGAELNRIEFSVAGEANLTRSLERNAELQVVLNKKDFEPGEEIELSIKAPYTGSGLITIERDRVFSHKWFKTSTTSTVEKIRIPAGVEGGAYVNVTFLRSMSSPEIFMSPLSYAVQPFSISLDDHKIDLKIEAPALVKPGESLDVKYSASKKTKIILYGVDEGILQVAGYKLPNPIEYFFQRQALQVLTYQLLDLLLPEYSVLQNLSSSGGGEAARLSKSLNPFKRKTEKPVVFWSGVLEATPTTKTYNYQVPDYFNGNIKVMAVASNGEAFGAAEQGVISRGDFVITSNVPTFVAPGDEFVVGVGLSNQAEGSGANAEIKLALKAPAFEVIGVSEQSLKIAEGHEGSTEFRLKAKSKLGSQPLQFVASHGGKSAKSTVETSIRPAVPYMTTLVGGRLPKAKFESPVTRELLPEFRVQTASMSPVPASFIHGLKVFLDGYPYGCSEQITSKVMPYVILKARPEFGIDTKKASEALRIALETLRTRQTNDGGFALYNASNGADRYASIYVAHMMVEAKDRGFSVPEEVLKKALVYLANQGSRGTAGIEDARMFAYGLYLRARAGQALGEDIKYLQDLLKTRYKEVWQQDVAAGWLAAAMKLVKQDEQAEKIFGAIKLGEKVKSNYRYYYDGFLRDTTLLFLGARHFPSLMNKMANDEAMAAAFEPLSRGYYNTHTAAFSILALDGFFRAAGQAEFLNKMKIAEVLANGQEVALRLPPGTVIPKVDFSAEAKALRFESASDKIPFYYMQVQSGFDRELPKEKVEKQLEVVRDFVTSGDNPVTSVKMGEELTVRLRIRATNKAMHSHVVLVDMLPSGLEPILEPIAMNSDSSVQYEGDLENNSEPPPPPPDYIEPYEEETSGEPDEAAYRFFRMLLPEALAQGTTTKLSPLYPQYVDRREDRMVVYAAAGPDIQEFRYRVKAIARGKFVVPPPYAEAMYDRDAQFRGLAGVFTVEAP
ncbi:MAG: alpha-2-macroglobulin [Bdellovibrionales bacterium]